MSSIAAARRSAVVQARSAGRSPLAVVGLFAGIGGLELGLGGKDAGHHPLALCELDAGAQAVLRAHFDVPLEADVTRYAKLPRGTELVTAGFPCQDLSQAGRGAGIGGDRSGLVSEVFRLLRGRDVPWVLLENVSFMLRLARGHALDVVLTALEELGYKWAYRVVDSRSFGLPQRRERVYFLASKEGDPRDVLLVDDAGESEAPATHLGLPCGFYWTEGLRGLGWAVDAIPTLKGGSTIGIASPPAIWLPDGRIVKPGIRDGERLQGFAPGWTEAAANGHRTGHRWKLVGNAVTVDAANWIGRRLRTPGRYTARAERELVPESAWPRAAYNVDGKRVAVDVSAWPERHERKHLSSFLNLSEVDELSHRAVAGFLKRYEQSGLFKPEGFLEALHAHRDRMARALVAVTPAPKRRR